MNFNEHIANLPLEKRPYYLTNGPVDSIQEEQLNLFTREGLQSQPVGVFNPRDGFEQLSLRDRAIVVAVDMGGDKIVVRTVQVLNGNLQVIGVEKGGIEQSLQSQKGIGYMGVLETAATYAKEKELKVGISIAALVYGTKVKGRSPNFVDFVDEFTNKYDGDFARLFGEESVSVANDAVAGMIAGSIAAVRRAPDVENCIYLINGTGIGGAVLQDSIIYANEPGHTPVIDELNLFRIEARCEKHGKGRACIELVAASGFGTTTTFNTNSAEPVDGRTLSKRYQDGDKHAYDFYNNSALVTAHAVLGMAQTHGDLLSVKNRDKTAVVLHGGCFMVPGYGERVLQIIERYLGYKPLIILTRETTVETTTNACLDGAAIGALLL